MTLLDITNVVKNKFPNSEINEVCHIVNELELRVVNEIFSPCGLSARTEVLSPETDANTPLILSEEYILLYVYYTYWAFSLKEMDLEAANVYSTVFNEKWNELAVFYRRNHTPTKKVLLSGGI